MAAPATESLTLPVLGMTCASCQHHVEEALRATAGVESAHVDLMAHRASVVFDPAMAAPEQLVEAIRGAGYDAVLPCPSDSAGAEDHDHADESAHKAWVTLAAGAAAMLLAMALGSQMSALDHALMRLFPWLYALPTSPLRWFLLVLTAFVVTWAGRGIYLNAIRALRHGTTNMNTLVGLGTSVAFLYSAYATVWPASGRDVYFDAVLLIIGFLLMGKALEVRAKRRALAARAAELTEHLTSMGPADPDVDRAALAQAEERWSEAGHEALLETVHADLEAGRGAVCQLTQARQPARAVWTEAIARALPFLRGWGCTAMAARANFPLTAGVVDLLVVDEASQCSIAQILPLAYRARRIVVVGDPNQLTPIVKLNRAHLENIADACGTTEVAMRQSSSSALTDSAFTAYAARAQRSHLLDEHYRCHPRIAAFINEHFYGGALRVLTDVSTFDEKPRGLSFINVDGRTERAPASGVFNIAEASAVTSWVQAHPDLTGTLGIVTPFAAQVSLIRHQLQKALGAEGFAAARITIGTAHAFQGGECDVVLFSLVLATDAPTGTAHWVEGQRNLINVAVSRAKRALVVFGDHAAIEELPVPTLHALVSSACVQDDQLATYASKDADVADVADLHSEAERRLYSALLRLGVPVQLKPVIEGYECDFTIHTPTGLLDIEVDGTQQTDERGRQRRQDLARDTILNAIGVLVIRIPAWRCLEDPEAALRELGRTWLRPMSR